MLRSYNYFVMPAFPALRPAIRPNLLTLPRALREAIPAEPAIGGRVLNLASIDAAPSPTFRGPRVQLRLLTEESGRLTGQFPILMDLDAASARRRAATLVEMAQRAVALEVGPGW